VLTPDELALELSYDLGFGYLQVDSNESITVSSVDCHVDYRTGEHTSYSWHITGTANEISDFSAQFERFLR